MVIGQPGFMVNLLIVISGRQETNARRVYFIFIRRKPWTISLVWLHMAHSPKLPGPRLTLRRRQSRQTISIDGCNFEPSRNSGCSPFC